MSQFELRKAVLEASCRNNVLRFYIAKLKYGFQFSSAIHFLGSSSLLWKWGTAEFFSATRLWNHAAQKIFLVIIWVTRSHSFWRHNTTENTIFEYFDANQASSVRQERNLNVFFLSFDFPIWIESWWTRRAIVFASYFKWEKRKFSKLKGIKFNYNRHSDTNANSRPIRPLSYTVILNKGTND